MSYGLNEHRILSRPLRLHWAGWETDTYRLQQRGWQLSVEQNVYRDSMRIMMKHDGMMMQAMTDVVDFDYRRALDGGFDDSYIRNMVVPCQAMGRTVNIHAYGDVSISALPIDATPTFTERRICRMEDFAHFAAPLARTQQIIVPDEDVTDLMDRILKLQDPARIERIREDVRRSHDPGSASQRQQAIHAQIISFPHAA